MAPGTAKLTPPRPYRCGTYCQRIAASPAAARTRSTSPFRSCQSPTVAFTAKGRSVSTPFAVKTVTRNAFDNASASRSVWSASPPRMGGNIPEMINNGSTETENWPDHPPFRNRGAAWIESATD